MPIPERYMPVLQLDDGPAQDIPWIAPLIGGVAPFANLNDGKPATNGFYFHETPFPGQLRGARKPLPEARDLTGWTYLTLAAFCRNYATTRMFDTLANGGLRLYLVDAAGNHAGYDLYGSDMATDAIPAWGYTTFSPLQQRADSMWWTLDLARSPDRAAGVLDLSGIVAIEVHFAEQAAPPQSVVAGGSFGLIMAHDRPILRGGDNDTPGTFALLARHTQPSRPDLTPGGLRHGLDLERVFDGGNGQTWAPIYPFTIGDGASQTHFRLARGQIAFQLSMASVRGMLAEGRTPEQLGTYLGDDANTRLVSIVQSPTDHVELTDMVWSGHDGQQRDFSLEVTGSASGTCLLTRNSFFRAGRVSLGHARAEDCIFDGCDAVEVTADTVLTGASIRGGRAGAVGLILAGGPGDYADITAFLSFQEGDHDVVVGAGGAGRYDLSGLRASGPLRLHNPTDQPVTVALAAGIVAVTSGGPVTVEQPRPVQSVSVSNGIPGTLLLIEDLTAAQTLYLGRPDTWPHVWTDPSPYAADRLIRIRAMQVAGTEATLFIDQIAGSVTEAAPALSFRLNQQIDAVHGANGIDGAAVTGVVFDDAAGLIRTNRSALLLPELYAAEAAFRATEAGITGTGRLLSAPDPANYLLSGARLRNEGAAPLTLSGGYLRGATGRAIDAIDGAGGTVLMAPDHVVAYAADGSGGADPAAIVAAMRTAFAAEIARINALPDDPAAQAVVLAAIEEAAAL